MTARTSQTQILSHTHPEQVDFLSRVKGGTYYPITVKKHLRAQAIAQENRMHRVRVSNHIHLC